MGRKQRRSQQKSTWIPPVGNGGIQKKQHSNRPAPSIIVPCYAQPDNHQIAGYPILPFAVRVEPVPSAPSFSPPHLPIPSQIPPPLPGYGHPPPPTRPPQYGQPPPPSFPPSTAPSVVIIPPRPVNTVRVAPNKSPRAKRRNAPVTVAVQSAPKGAATEAVTKKVQLKYAIQLASRAKKRKSVSVQREVKTDPEEAGFNLFKHIAQRYRGVQKSPEPIDIPDDNAVEEEVEEIEQNGTTSCASNMTIVEDIDQSSRDTVTHGHGSDHVDRLRSNRTRYPEEAVPLRFSLKGEERRGEGHSRRAVGNSGGDDDDEEEEGGLPDRDWNRALSRDGPTHRSICTVDEVGEETMAVVEEREGEEEEEEIVCLGEQKTSHVLSEVVTLEDDDDDDSEVEEIDMSNDSTMMNKAFSEQNKSLPLPMVESVIDLSLDDDNGEKVTSGSNLPDFIPLIDEAQKNKGARRRRSKGRQQQSQSVQPIQQVVVHQTNGETQSQNGSSFPWPSAPIVGMTRSKSAKEKRRDNYRKKAETRAMEVGASPSTVARALAASTCSFPQAPTPSKIPLPHVAAPPTPLARLYSCPPGSVAVASSAMGLIQSRGFSTSAPHSQPVNFGDYGMVHAPPSSLVSVAGASSGSNPTTLAGVLHDETAGVVRDALTANGIFRRQWEENWRLGPASADVKVDPSAAPFRICSYNVLCQKTITATEYLYRHTRFQPHVLEWSHRWPLIQKELSELNADVFGLQEIQDIHFEEYYEPFMKSLGYVCLFQRKSETAHSDGLGIFVRANRFKISSIKTVDFLVPGDNLLNRGNVAQLLRVECLQTGASLIITNTHILFNEKRGDVKLGQIALLMANIHAIRQEDEPVICLGDWNLEPSSDLYNYITSGRLDASQFVPRYGSGQVKEGRNFYQSPMKEMPMDTHLKTRMSRDGVLYQSEGALLQSLQRTPPSVLSHQIPLTSTYAPYQERHVSTFHKDTANPDFIFYTTAGRGEAESRRLRLIRRLAVPPEANIRQCLEPWPNHHVPSDHIPLMAEFYLAK